MLAGIVLFVLIGLVFSYEAIIEGVYINVNILCHFVMFL